MVKMRSKKGAIGHVEIIISFLIFIAFVVFLLAFINPIEKTKDNKYYLEMTEKAIMEYLKANLTTFSVSFGEGTVSLGVCSCFEYDYPDNVVGKDEDYNRVGAVTIGNYVCIQPVSDGENIKRFYRLYFSEEFIETGACNGPPEDFLLFVNYTLGVLNEYKKISNKSLYNLEQSYTINYENLRTNILKLDSYFNFEVRTTEGSLLAHGNIKEPKETDIIARDIPIEVINEEGDIIPAIMNIQVWE